MIVQDAYDNLEKIITQGFLCYGAYFNKHNFVMKTLTDKEAKNIRFYVPRESPDNIFYRLAFSTFMLDGINYINRRENITEVADFYRRVPSLLAFELLHKIDNMQEEYIKSLKFFEGFCYTDRSRFIWKMLNKSNPIDKDFIGITGVSKLGLNSVQENWIIINQNIDKEEEYEVQFQLSVLVASSFNSKGAKSVTQNYQFHKNEQEQHRKDIAKYGYDKKRVIEEKKKNKWTSPLKTKEDLVRELNRQMRGEKDLHDLFIEKWIKEQKRKAEEAKEAVMKKQIMYRKKIDSISDENVEGSSMVSNEKMRDILSDKKNKFSNPGISYSIDNFNTIEEKERYLKKISARVIK